MWETTLSVLLLSAAASCLDLTLLHTNDLHSRFDQISGRGSACRAKDLAAGNCFGGVSRIKYKVDQIKRENPNKVVFVNAGDFFQVKKSLQS